MTTPVTEPEPPEPDEPQEQHESHEPSGPDEPQGPWRSPAAAALANLTGLGLGYAYLRHRRRALAAAALTLLLVAVAFATDAASTPVPWWVLAVVVPGAAAADGWRLARRQGAPSPPGRAERARPVAVALGLVAVVVLGYLGYGAWGRSVYADAMAAQARGDCPAAITGFDAVSGPFELMLSSQVRQAPALRAECTEFLAARAAQERGAFTDAVSGYRQLRSEHPQSVLAPFVSENLRRSYAAWAARLRDDGQFDQAIKVYRNLLVEKKPASEEAVVRADVAATYLARAVAIQPQMASAEGTGLLNLVRAAVDDLQLVGREFPDTPSAAALPTVLAGTYQAAIRPLFDGQKFCATLPALEFFAQLPVDAAPPVPEVGRDRPRALLECGLTSFREGKHDAAIPPLDELAADYPNDGGIPQARSVVIAARVAQATGATVPLPEPYIENVPGGIELTYYNDSPYETTVRLAGRTAHELVMPACAECPTYDLGERGCTVREGRPSVTVRLYPGDYAIAVSGPPQVSGIDDKATLESGYRYSNCVWASSTRPALPGFDPDLLPDLVPKPR